MGQSSATTQGITVEVESDFIAERSEPAKGVYFFQYQVTISNSGNQAATLLTREWVITDGNGRIEKVNGPGVVGKLPHLEPGGSFVYTSFCPLPTPIGSMRGRYRFVRPDGREFDAKIAAFALEVPEALN